METVAGTALKVKGHNADQLARQLESYIIDDRTNTARSHLMLAGSSKLTISLYQTGTKCGFSNGVVEISWEACREQGSISLKNLAESALFELQNGINKQRFDRVDQLLANNSITLLQYGLEKSKIEAESTIKTAKIISGMPSYVPSEWGRRQKDKYNRHSGNFVGYFVEKPHFNIKRLKPGEVAPPNHFYLKSKYFYAYEALISNIYSGKLEKIYGILKKITRTDIRPADGAENWDLVKYALEKVSGQKALSNSYAVFYYIRTLEILKTNGWVVNWNETAPQDWINYAANIIEKNVIPMDRTVLNTMVARFRKYNDPGTKDPSSWSQRPGTFRSV